MSYLNISANFRVRAPSLPSIEEQYADLWRFANHLQSLGIGIDQWYPPAETEEASLLNRAFNSQGVTEAALAMAHAAESGKKKKRSQSLGVWRGIEGSGGMALTTMLSIGPLFSNLDFGGADIPQFEDWRNVASVVKKIVELWAPARVGVNDTSYMGAFDDRPAIGWMTYLPFVITTKELSIAPALVPVMDGGQQLGTIVVTKAGTFDANNHSDVKNAHDIEIALVDKDLLPTRTEFVQRF